MGPDGKPMAINEWALFPLCELCFGRLAAATMADGQEWCSRCADWYARWNSMSAEEWMSSRARRRAG